MGGKRIYLAALVASSVMLAGAAALPAVAREPQTLAPGDHGRAVKRLQVKVAGWFPLSKRKVYFALDGMYGSQTAQAVARMQRRYGLKADGVARRSVFRIFRRLRDADGSTRHFDWSEFNQNKNRACSAGANAYAGTFGGGMVSARRARRNVRRLMWRLEALRAKAGSNPIGVNSGFRSVPYNDCIGGARSSQHLFGTAADNRVADVRNRRSRRVAKRSEFHGIGCYSSLTHNHFDIRMDNRALRSSRAWWWPDRDRKGRDLDAGGRPCWGQRRRGASGEVALGTVRAFGARVGSLVPSPAEVRAFAAAGEPRHLRGAD